MKLGQIVMYLPLANPIGNTSYSPQAAMITYVEGNGKVYLTIFPPLEPPYHINHVELGYEPGKWRYID